MRVGVYLSAQLPSKHAENVNFVLNSVSTNGMVPRPHPRLHSQWHVCHSLTLISPFEGELLSEEECEQRGQATGDEYLFNLDLWARDVVDQRVKEVFGHKSGYELEVGVRLSVLHLSTWY